MKLKLESNFRDFYDHAFDLSGPAFKRYDTGGLSRPEMFEYLTRLGFTVPRHGTVKSVVVEMLTDAEWSEHEKSSVLSELVSVVVYTDESAHAGEGKVLMSGAAALRKYSERFCAEYIPTTPSGNGLSFRYLQVGQRRWWLRYWSEEDWRSNVGEGGVEVLVEEEPAYIPGIKFPMFAIDFIRTNDRRLVAVDFNTAPGLRPIRGQISSMEVVDELKTFLSSTA